MYTNYKGSLQEYCQRCHLPLPTYQLLKQSGPPHAPKFQVSLLVYSNVFMKQVSCIKFFFNSKNIYQLSERLRQSQFELNLPY
jgi:hypothetical protein